MPSSSARERILETAIRLFYARGIRAVGVDLIIAESGVAKATFYKHFPAKDELVLAYLDQVDRAWTAQLHAAAAAAGPEPADQLVGLFDALDSACRRDGYRGCGFINAAAETVPGTPVHARTVAHKQAVLAWVRDLAARAGAPDPDGLARSLTLLLDGGLADGALSADPVAATAARRTARVLVTAATGRGRPGTTAHPVGGYVGPRTPTKARSAMDPHDKRTGADDGEVSEVNALQDGTEPVSPGDATAGYPESESGEAEEGTAGPDAPPRHGRPEPTNESSR